MQRNLADSAKRMAQAHLKVMQRRAQKGPKHPTWSFGFEVMVEAFQMEMEALAHIPNASEQRKFLDTFAIPIPLPSGVKESEIKLDGLAAKLYEPKSAPIPGTILYFHGGGYVLYPKLHRILCGNLARVSRRRVVVPDYRLAPENPFPEGIDDGVQAYRHLLHGKDAVYLGGDSAGGGLALAVIQKARDLKLPFPQKTFLLSPWVNLEPTKLGEGAENLDAINPTVSTMWSRWYLQGTSEKEPLASPLYADLKEFPSLYVQSGDVEILHEQISLFVTKAENAGVSITWDCFPGMIHAFQLLGRLLPEGREAFRKIGNYLNRP